MRRDTSPYLLTLASNRGPQHGVVPSLHNSFSLKSETHYSLSTQSTSPILALPSQLLISLLPHTHIACILTAFSASIVNSIVAISETHLFIQNYTLIPLNPIASDPISYHTMSESTTFTEPRPSLSNRSNENIMNPRPSPLRSNENLPPTVNHGSPIIRGRPRTLSGPLGSRLTEKFSYTSDSKGLPTRASVDVISEGSEDNTDAAAQLDTLLAELEMEDGKEDDVATEEVKGEEGIGVPEHVGEELLQTNRRRGLEEREVLVRRKAFGWNQLKEHRERRWKQFAMFFVGPIQFVMEVCC